MIIRDVSIEDLGPILKLGKEEESKIAPQGFYSEHELGCIIDSGTHRPFLVAEDSGLAGFAIGFVDVNSIGYILYLAVSKKRRRIGIGKMLVEECLKRFKSMGVKTLFITVDKNNRTAIRFYEKIGFNKIVESILMEKGIK